MVTDTAGATGPMGVVTGDFVFVGDVGRPDLLEKAARVAGTMDGGRARHSVRAWRSSARSRTTCRSGPATAPARRAARASARCRRARSATRSSSTGRFGVDDEEEFVDAGARRPAGAAEVLRRDEAHQQRRARRSSVDSAVRARLSGDAARRTARGRRDHRGRAPAAAFAARPRPGHDQHPARPVASPPGRGGCCRTTGLLPAGRAGIPRRARRGPAGPGADRARWGGGVVRVATRSTAWGSARARFGNTAHMTPDELPRGGTGATWPCSTCGARRSGRRGTCPGVKNIPLGYLLDRSG